MAELIAGIRGACANGADVRSAAVLRIAGIDQRTAGAGRVHRAKIREHVAHRDGTVLDFSVVPRKMLDERPGELGIDLCILGA
jgi:hypothetical protein